jgi:hypothetical protein
MARRKSDLRHQRELFSTLLSTFFNEEIVETEISVYELLETEPARSKTMAGPQSHEEFLRLHRSFYNVIPSFGLGRGVDNYETPKYRDIDDHTRGMTKSHCKTHAADKNGTGQFCDPHGQRFQGTIQATSQNRRRLLHRGSHGGYERSIQTSPSVRLPRNYFPSRNRVRRKDANLGDNCAKRAPKTEFTGTKFGIASVHSCTVCSPPCIPVRFP